MGVSPFTLSDTDNLVFLSYELKILMTFLSFFSLFSSWHILFRLKDELCQKKTESEHFERQKSLEHRLPVSWWEDVESERTGKPGLFPDVLV